MEIEKITSERTEYQISMNKDEAFDTAMMLLDTYRRNGNVNFGRYIDNNIFMFTVKENNAP